VDDRTPVLVGVGTARGDAEASDLMVLAAQLAADDAGTPALLGAVERIAVPRGTWAYTDPARLVGDAIGAPRARRVLVNLGIPQQTLINDALRQITAGQLDVVLIVGAEARARAAREAREARAGGAAPVVAAPATRAGMGAGETDPKGGGPDEVQSPTGKIVADAEIEAGLVVPVEQYAMIDSSLRRAEGSSVEAHRREIAELWARFNLVARNNPDAAFPAPMTAEDILRFGPHNRPLAFPYGKWHASQWTVDQGAALLLCSAGAAARLRVPRDRWVFPLVGIESSFELPLVARRAMHRWPAMAVLGQAASARLARPVSECDHVELYSCFPAAVRVQQRELGLALDRTPTVTGGMTFAGGPFNSFVLEATAALARRVRNDNGTGLVTTVSGLLTKPGLAVWASAPDGKPPLVADLARDAEAATPSCDVRTDYRGRATVAACTVTYDGIEPVEMVSILETADGERLIHRTRDPEVVHRATSEELLGTALTV
jgi:acetyl-CoA C-acetyltransferase